MTNMEDDKVLGLQVIIKSQINFNRSVFRNICKEFCHVYRIPSHFHTVIFSYNYS